MRRISRDRLVVGLLGVAAVVGGCSRLTAVDWTLIPASSEGNTGATNAGGAAGEPTGGAPNPSGGESGAANGGESGESGAAGQSGAGGETGGTFGTGGTGGGGNGGLAGQGGKSGNAGTGGNGGTSGGGTGGTGGTAGSTGTGGIPPCTGTPGPLTDAMVLFAGPAKPTAARGGRVGLDADCEAERVRLGLTQTKTHAFITIDASDFIAGWTTKFPDLPANPGTKDERIVGPTGIEIASSWKQLLQAGAEQSMICAKVLPSDAFWWLSGSNFNGMMANVGEPALFGQYGGPNETCNGWTSGVSDPVILARPGSAQYAGQLFLNAGTLNAQPFLLVSCDSTAVNPILCLAYTP